MKKILTLFLSLAVAIASCNKVQPTQKIPTKKLHLNNYGDVDAPTVSNGMLVFTDGDHLQDYLDYLSAAITCDSNDPGDHDADSILAIIESGNAGFNSLRAQAKAAFDILNEEGWENVEEIPEVHYIKDICFRSILNEDGDVQVGSYITHYINKYYNVDIPASNTTMLSGLHGLSASPTVDEIQLVLAQDTPYLYLGEEANVLTTSMQKTTTDLYHIATPSRTYPNPCSEPTRIRLNGMNLAYIDNGQLQSATFEIFWGDGASSHDLAYSFSSTIYNADAEHTYASAGKYHVLIRAKSNGPNTTQDWVATTEFDMTIDAATCKYMAQRESPTIWHYTDGDRAWNGKCWIEQKANNYGPHCKIEARTETFRKISNKWHKKNGDNPAAEIWCDLYDENCVFKKNEFHGAYSGVAKECFMRDKIPYAFGWTELKSRHSIKHYGTTYSFDIYIHPCD